MQEVRETFLRSGRKITIGEQKGKQLADCNLGFCPLLHKIQEIVQEYVESKKLKNPLKVKDQV